MKKPTPVVPKGKTIVAQPGKVLIACLLFLATPFLGGAIECITAFDPISLAFSNTTALLFIVVAAIPVLALLFLKAPKIGWVLFTASVVILGGVLITPEVFWFYMTVLGEEVPLFTELVATTPMTVEQIMTWVPAISLGISWFFLFLGVFSPKSLKAGKFFLILFTLLLTGGILALLGLYWNVNRADAEWNILGLIAIPAIWQLGFAFFLGGMKDSARLNPATTGVPNPGFQPQGFGQKGQPNEKGFSMANYRQQGNANPAMAGVPQMAYQGYPQPGYPQGYPQPGYPPNYPQQPMPQGYYMPPPGVPYGAMPPSPQTPIMPKLGSGSRFTGQPVKWLFLQFGAFLLSILTAFLGVPAAVCMTNRYLIQNTVIDGHKLHFDGQAKELFGKWIGWLFLTILTAGIFLFFLPAKVKNWVVSHTHLV